MSLKRTVDAHISLIEPLQLPTMSENLYLVSALDPDHMQIRRMQDPSFVPSICVIHCSLHTPLPLSALFFMAVCRREVHYTGRVILLLLSAGPTFG
jgi:hypothetical protein